jgi:hypothetical protein
MARNEVKKREGVTGTKGKRGRNSCCTRCLGMQPAVRPGCSAAAAQPPGFSAGGPGALARGELVSFPTRRAWSWPGRPEAASCFRARGAPGRRSLVRL